VQGSKTLGDKQTAFDAELAAIEPALLWYQCSHYVHMIIHSDSQSAIARSQHSGSGSRPEEGEVDSEDPCGYPLAGRQICQCGRSRELTRCRIKPSGIYQGPGTDYLLLSFLRICPKFVRGTHTPRYTRSATLRAGYLLCCRAGTGFLCHFFLLSTYLFGVKDCNEIQTNKTKRGTGSESLLEPEA